MYNPTMPEWPSLDASPIDSDYEDIRELFGAMREAADEHSDWLFLAADDPGHHHDPPREL